VGLTGRIEVAATPSRASLRRVGVGKPGIVERVGRKAIQADHDDRPVFVRLRMQKDRHDTCDQGRDPPHKCCLLFQSTFPSPA